MEFFQGPLLAPGDVEALGGSTTAMAEGVNGATVNAASPAIRDPYSVRWVDVDVDVGLSLPGGFSTMDYDNHDPAPGKAADTVNDFLHANAGVRLELGDFGVATTADLLRYTVTSHGGLDVTAGRYHVLAAYGFLSNQLVVGAGIRAVTMQLSQGGGIASGFNPIGASLTMSGLGPEVGFIIKPNDLPFRIGATFRSAVDGSNLGTGSTTTDANGVVRSGGVIVPGQITEPWELEAGFALQIGPRPLNPTWRNPHDSIEPLVRRIDRARAARERAHAAMLATVPPLERGVRAKELQQEEENIRRIEEQELTIEEAQLRAIQTARYANWPREKILVMASVLVTGSSSNTIALEDFFDQQLEPYAQSVDLSPRIGIEAEPVRNYLKARIGSYLEPSRFSGVAVRQHFTAGFDAKLFAWSVFGLLPGQVWRVSGVADVAPRYSDWGLSIGAWH